MKKLLLAALVSSASLFCGCDKQAKINSQKIDVLSERIAHQEQIQSKQLALLQAQMAMLPPQLDKEASEYFEKNHDYALFFHTNTLYLLLTIGKQIEAQLQAAEVARTDQNSQAYHYHTNEVSTAFLCAAQIEEEMTALTKRLEGQINAETRQNAVGLSNALVTHFAQAARPDPAELAWRKQTETQVAQIRQELEAINARLSAMITNPPIIVPPNPVPPVITPAAPPPAK